MQITVGQYSYKRHKKLKGLLIKPLPYNMCVERMQELNKKGFRHEARFSKVIAKNSQLFGPGWTFLRNYPVLGRYFGDFVAMKRNVVIEIYEDHHLGQTEADEVRINIMKKAGYQVLILWASESDEDWILKTSKFVSGLRRPVPSKNDKGIPGGRKRKCKSPLTKNTKIETLDDFLSKGGRIKKCY